MLLMLFTRLSSNNKTTLLDIAKKSIAYGLQHNQALALNINEFEPALQNSGASFVTLHLNNKLRGCIGTLEAYRALATDVAEHAFSAAFEDPRFNKVCATEIDQLEISISILTPASEIKFTSESDLLNQLKPEIDGIILQSDFNKATFLPSVWEQLPEKKLFLEQLKLKAGLERNDWPDNIKIFRYESIIF